MPFLLVALLLGGCIPTARDFRAYQGKAVDAAQKTLSAVRSASLSAKAASTGRAFAPYTGVALQEAEAEASAVQTTFGAIQPHGRPSEALRDKLDPILSQAVSGLAELRIEARTGNMRSLERVARPLLATARDLETFIRENR